MADTNGNAARNTIWLLATLLTLAVGVIGIMAGHVTTRSAMAEEIDEAGEMFVPRTEIEKDLDHIMQGVSRIEKSMNNHIRDHGK